MPCAFFHSFLHKLPVVRRILSRKSRGTKVMLLQTSRPRRFPDSSQFLPQLPALSVHSVIGHECHKLLPAVDSPRAKCANKLHTTDRVRVSGKSTRKCQPDARLLCGWRTRCRGALSALSAMSARQLHLLPLPTWQFPRGGTAKESVNQSHNRAAADTAAFDALSRVSPNSQVSLELRFVWAASRWAHK